MKYSKLLYGLLLISPISLAQITTFGTKNNTYSINPAEIEDKLTRCPSTKDTLPIIFSRTNSKNLNIWYNANVIVGKYKKQGYTESYSEIYADNSKFSNAYYYGYNFNKDYNYVTNNDFYSYLNGYSPYLTHTVYQSLYRPGVPDSDRLPLFISSTKFMRDSNVESRVYIPNKEFDVSEILITKDTYDLHSGKILSGLKKSEERLYNILKSNRYGDNILGRIRIYKTGNKAEIAFWFGQDLITLYDTYNGNGSHNANYAKSNIFKNVEYSGNDAKGYFVIDDIRKIKDIRFHLRKNSWANHNPNGIWGVVNYKGDRPWIANGDNFSQDWRITDDMLNAENRFYQENKCFN